MRFIVDAQLPPALARLMAASGLKTEHAIDVGLHDSEDSSTRHSDKCLQFGDQALYDLRDGLP